MHNPLGSGFFILFLNNRDIGKIKGSLDIIFKEVRND